MKKWEKPMIQELHLSYTNDEIGLYTKKPDFLYCSEPTCCKVYTYKLGDLYLNELGGAAIKHKGKFYCSAHSKVVELQAGQALYCS